MAKNLALGLGLGALVSNTNAKALAEFWGGGHHPACAGEESAPNFIRVSWHTNEVDLLNRR